MKRTVRVIALLLSLIMAAAALTGCSGASKSASSSTAAPAATAEATATAAPEATASAAPASSDTVTVQDMAGRSVEVPAKITKVYGSDPVATNFMYTFDDSMMVGTNYDLTDEEKKFTSDTFQNLPNLGGWYGQGNEGNVEEIIKAKPDIVLSDGTDSESVSFAEELQDKLGIPVLTIYTDDFAGMASTYRFLGKLFGNEERGEELAKYTEDAYAAAQAVAAKVPDDKKVSVYYAEGELGLNTDPSGSYHTMVLDACGGINVAQVESPSGYGAADVSIEQVISWKPQYIIASSSFGDTNTAVYDTIMSDSKWSTIPAVKDGHVYLVPCSPLSWFDRPPSCNIVIGLYWMSNLLYPDYTDFDIKDKAKEFYKLFYHYDLTDSDLTELLQYAVRS